MPLSTQTLNEAGNGHLWMRKYGLVTLFAVTNTLIQELFYECSVEVNSDISFLSKTLRALFTDGICARKSEITTKLRSSVFRLQTQASQRLVMRTGLTSIQTEKCLQLSTFQT